MPHGNKVLWHCRLYAASAPNVAGRGKVLRTKAAGEDWEQDCRDSLGRVALVKVMLFPDIFPKSK